METSCDAFRMELCTIPSNKTFVGNASILRLFKCILVVHSANLLDNVDGEATLGGRKARFPSTSVINVCQSF